MAAFRTLRTAGLALGVVLVMAGATRAQTILRDAEVERALSELARPLLNAAGLSPRSVRILVVKDSSLNAFVLNQQTIMIHSGLMLKMNRPEMLQGVIAHEIAHIANGHLTRRMQNMQNAQTAAMIGLALSAAVASKYPGAAAGLAMGTQGSAQRVFLGHTRAEEASADRAGMRYMARAGIDPGGMVGVMEKFEGQEVLNVGRQDPYVRSHPLTRDRLRAARNLAATFKQIKGTDPNSAYWYDRSRAKLAAYLQNPSQTLRRLNASDKSDAALVARATAYSQSHQIAPALAAAEQLIARRPEDAYAHELKAWIHMEARQFNASVAAYARAVDLAPNQPLLLAGYGRALLAQNTSTSNVKALEVLEKSRIRDKINPGMLRDLGLAYARAGNDGMASLSAAERYALSGRLKDASIHAKRASGLLPRGSTGWRRAQDIVHAADAQKKRKKR
ncbi:putative Zn-dependent protease [Aliiruegeria haliotis]|uniref:Putative Zn-dependent protease n=1 Tax=Aliiruegeria haliotis TaxID=1280846 RepID=A0A2T0RZB2_9RHOB|nr:M48 family metalloprotease [Aliiruegeria haliotis]PRY26515.1 putative Zn-dependent protease [Aliiruegeria haliotis]